uniref:SDE2/SF3A3 SAP domain-containing protein n=1 Tax=Picea sitchensis TaxID=3332 RepID=B8LNK5_PICSI|nr:unknown [Picea sitchensis]
MEVPVVSLGENDNDCNEIRATIVLEKEESTFLGDNYNGCGKKDPCVELKKEDPVTSSSIYGQNITSPSLVEDEITSNANVEKCQLSCSEISASVTAGCSSDTTGVQGEMDSVCDSNGSMAGPLNFNDFNTAEEMEVLGLERLKNELQIRGLKCGGSVTERAARLFLLKITPLEKLHKKHFAKSKDLGK